MIVITTIFLLSKNSSHTLFNNTWRDEGDFTQYLLAAALRYHMMIYMIHAWYIYDACPMIHPFSSLFCCRWDVPFWWRIMMDWHRLRGSMMHEGAQMLSLLIDVLRRVLRGRPSAVLAACRWPWIHAVICQHSYVYRIIERPTALDTVVECLRPVGGTLFDPLWHVKQRWKNIATCLRT